MKKIISALLMASVIAISAAGCGYNDALEQASKANQQTTSASQSSDSTSDETSKVTDANYKDTFAAICRIRVIIQTKLSKQKWTHLLSVQSRALSTA